jgi:hypothetical protein
MFLVRGVCDVAGTAIGTADIETGVLFDEIRPRCFVTLLAERFAFDFEKLRMIAAVRFMADGAAFVERRVTMLLREFFSIVAGHAQFRHSCFQQMLRFTFVRIVAGGALAVLRGIVHETSFQAELDGIVAQCAEFVFVIFEPQHADFAVRLVTGQALAFGGRVVTELAAIIIFFMTSEAIALLGKTLAAFNLRPRARAPQQKSGGNQQQETVKRAVTEEAIIHFCP